MKKSLKTLRLMLMALLCMSMLFMTACGEKDSDDEEETKTEESKDKDKDDEDEDKEESKEEASEESKVEESAVEESKVEESKVEESKVEESSVETTTTVVEAEEGSLVGSWNIKLDVMPAMLEGMGLDEADADTAALFDNFDKSSIYLTAQFDFNADGTCLLAVDESSVDDFLAEVKSRLAVTLRAYFEEMIAQSGMEMTVDELLEMQGIDSLEAFIDEAFAGQIDFSDLTSELNQEGYYRVEGDKLYIADTEAELDDADSNELTWVNSNKVLIDGEDEYGFFPMELNRQ